MAKYREKRVIARRKINKVVSLVVLPFDIYNEAGDRKIIKEFADSIFETGDLIFFYFRRIEDLTNDTELKGLKVRIMDHFEKNGKYLYLRKFDEERFDSIGMLTYDYRTPGLIIDMWRYFYGICPIIPVL